MTVPVRSLEWISREVDAGEGKATLLVDTWYAHQSTLALRLAPMAAQPGLLVRGQPATAIPPGFWAVELRGELYPFAVGDRPESAAGCLQRLAGGRYDRCPSSIQPLPASDRPPEPAGPAAFGLVGFGRGVLHDLWETAVVRSTVGLVMLLALYGIGYWLWLAVTGTYFLEVAPFRVWKDAAPGYLSEGLAARVVDELQRLQRDIGDHGKGAQQSDLAFLELTEALPAAAQVTIEFQGMSPEALNAFLRRLLRRHQLITGDLLPHRRTTRLIGRAAKKGSWEVAGPRGFADRTMDHALCEFAVRAVVALRDETRPALANALAYRQSEAFAKEKHEEALRLAELGLVAMPDEAVQHFNAGVAYQKLERLDDAITAFSKAIDRSKENIKLKALAFKNRATAYRAKKLLEPAGRDLVEAMRLDPKAPWIEEAANQAGLSPEGTGAADQAAGETPDASGEPAAQPKLEGAGEERD